MFTLHNNNDTRKHASDGTPLTYLTLQRTCASRHVVLSQARQIWVPQPPYLSWVRQPSISVVRSRHSAYAERLCDTHGHAILAAACAALGTTLGSPVIAAGAGPTVREGPSALRS